MATSGFGTLLKRNGTTIANCQNITGPGMTLGTTESTHQTSTAGWREYIATLLSGGEVTFDANFLPADATQSVLAFLGQRGVMLLAASATDGKTLAQYQLPALPVYDGLAAADGKLYLALEDDTLLCLGARENKASAEPLPVWTAREPSRVDEASAGFDVFNASAARWIPPVDSK